MNIDAVKSFLNTWKADQQIALMHYEPQTIFKEDAWTSKLGQGLTSVISDGDVIEKGAVNFSNVIAQALPEAATTRRPELAGAPFEACGVSTVIHPRNPHIPTAHANLRLFSAQPKDQDPVWWFGGGFDLTPYYLYQEDCQLWHQAAYDACSPFGHEVYSEFKAYCDRYFFLKHRNEARGVGGLFFDDVDRWSFETCFAFIQAIGKAFIEAYTRIIERRINTPYTEEQRNFQAYRRARYVEFNLLFDRGTLFGLQSGGRTESILVSMPPTAKWAYQWAPEPGSAEAKLYDALKPIDWLGLSANDTNR